MATKKRTPVPAKRRPAKKKVKAKKKKRAVAIMLMPEIIQVEVPDMGNASRDFLRYAAGLHYSTDLNGGTVKQLSEHVMFQSVPISTLEKWSIKDNWGPRRRDLLDRWRIQIEAKLGDKLIQGKILLVEQMAKIQEALFARLTPLDHDWVEGPRVVRNRISVMICGHPKCGQERGRHLDPFWGVSGDKAVEALLKLVKVREDLSEAVLQVTATPGYGAGAAAGHATGRLGGPMGLDKPNLTTEEVRGAAMAILKARRANTTTTIGDDDATS